MVFEFAKYTEITDFVFEVRPQYKEEGYIRFFICPDVNDYWFVRILEGFNEDYEDEEGSFLLERNGHYKAKGETLTLSKLKKIIEEDDGGNLDYYQDYSLEDSIERLDGGFGILNLKES